jgi:hypothetical protein
MLFVQKFYKALNNFKQMEKLSKALATKKKKK